MNDFLPATTEKCFIMCLNTQSGRAVKEWWSGTEAHLGGSGEGWVKDYENAEYHYYARDQALAWVYEVAWQGTTVQQHLFLMIFDEEKKKFHCIGPIEGGGGVYR